MTSSRTSRVALGALAAAAVLALSACSGSGSDSSDKASDAASSDASSSSSPSAGAAAGPDLDGIPDVVAEVNGEEVTRDDFVPVYTATWTAATAQASTTGQQPDEDQLRKQALDDLVDTELLYQEADARGLEVSDADIDAELADLAQQNGMGSADDLLKAVEAQGLSEEQARDQVETQVMVEKLVADEDGPYEPTQQELRAIYDQAKQAQAAQGGQAADFPKFAAVRDQLVEQAQSQEIGKVADSLLTGLRKDADISLKL